MCVVCNTHYTFGGSIELGKEIRDARESKQLADKKAWSLRKCAARWSIEPSYLSKIERGELVPGEEDGEIVLTESMRNLLLWRSKDTRQAFHDIAWGVVRNDKHSDLLAANQYNWMEKDVRKKHPAWFADEDAAKDEEDKVDSQAPATKADIASLSNQLDGNAHGLDSIAKALGALMSRSGWIWWFSLGALVASLSHF